MKLIDNKAVQITVSEQVGNSIVAQLNKSAIIKNHGKLVDVLVNWGVQEMTYLNRAVRFKTALPSPIVKEYNWPGLYKLLTINELPLNF